MNPMRSALGPVLASLTLVAALGAVHGVYTDRWGRSARLEEAVAALDRVPARVGDWEGQDIPLRPSVLKTANIEGYVQRSYANPRTGETVTVLIVCGRGGPISVHTPDVCYAGAGYRQLAPEAAKELDTGGGRPDAFNVARFGMPGVVPAQMEIYWGWSADGLAWQAPSNPRASLARLPALYKMYVVREFTPGSRAAGVDSCEAFLQRALPVIRQTLPPAAG
jgi:hypothetical protein